MIRKIFVEHRSVSLVSVNSLVHDENCFIILVIKLLAHRDVFNQT
jgi:hypothetical protein